MARPAENRERDRVLRSWIMQSPRPSSLRVTINNERQTVVCGSSTWAQVAQTVAALGPEMIEALDNTGSVLRATSALDLFEPDLEIPAAPTVPTPPPAPPGPGSLSISELVGDDAESRRFALVAHLLADAYRHSQQVVCDKLSEIASQQAARATQLESIADNFVQAERLRVERLRRDLEVRQQQDDDDDDETDTKPGVIDEAISKIARHIAGTVGGDDDEDDDDNGDAGREQPPAPNGSGGHA